MTAIRVDTSVLSADQRANVEQALIRSLRRRYPGRAVTISWGQTDTLADRQPAARTHDDRGEDAA